MPARRKKAIPPFASNLSRLMKEKNVGVREAARICGVAPSTLAGWRNGIHPMDFIALKKLARGLGTTLSFLLTGESEPPSIDGSPKPIAEAFQDGGVIFEGYAEILIRKLVPRAAKSRRAQESVSSVKPEPTKSNGNGGRP